jgi:hypothetical protein
LTALFSARSEVATASLPDGAALLDMRAGKYFALNRVGALVWSSLQEAPASLENLTSHVSSAFKIEPEVCRQDITSFLNTMVKAGLVETRPERP